jgi:hypothetical protein
MNLRQYLILGVTDPRLSDSVRISAFTRIFDELCAAMTRRMFIATVANYSLMVRITLVVGRSLTVGSFWSLRISSS